MRTGTKPEGKAGLETPIPGHTVGFVFDIGPILECDPSSSPNSLAFDAASFATN